MGFKNVKLDDYCLNLDLHKSMFFIDVLEDTHAFTLKGDEIEIWPKWAICKTITRKELIYFIHVEMVSKYEYSSLKEKMRRSKLSDLSKEEQIIRKFYSLFETIDSIHKAIDNMVYLEKFLKKQSVIVQEKPSQKVIVESSPPKKPECGGWEEDEESSDEEEINELGENKKLVLKNALEKECLSARTELFRPAWRPPR